MRKLLLIFLMIIMGAALSLAFPRASLWPIAWVGLSPLLFLVRDSRPRTAALAGLAFGIGFFGVLVYWIGVFGYTVWVLLTLKEALPIALFGALASIVYRSRRQWLVFIAVPALWTAVEWLRSLGTYGFPWGYLAYSHAHNLQAVQIVSLTGTWGLTFVIALFNVALVFPKGRIFRSVVIATVVAAAVHAGGYWVMNRETPQREKLSVIVVQPAMHENRTDTLQQRVDQMLSIYTQLATEAVRYQPDLMVWPESAIPLDIVTSHRAHGLVARIAQASGAHVLIGGPHNVSVPGTKDVTIMNGAHMLSPNGAILGSYYKVRLAPFGEFVPGRSWLPFLDHYDIRDFDIQPGEKHVLLPTSFGETGVIICFESTFPAIARRETIDGANVLCMITKETQFKKTALAPQHHDVAIFRAVENRRFIIRSAASGISSIIDPYGRIQDQLGMWKRGVLYGEVETRKNLTIYTRFGDWFAYLCILIAACGVGSGIAAQRKKKHSGM